VQPDHELQAARARLVDHELETRRSVERELHDGAQQYLSALAVTLQLAREAGSPEELGGRLDDMAHDVREASEALRALAHRMYPALLADRGLADALPAAAVAAGIPTRVCLDGLERYPDPVEAAIYFCCVESLTNTARHAGSSARATVEVTAAAGELVFTVSDDGSGFQPDQVRCGRGLEIMRDRMAAVGGALSLRSAPGSGTTVAGRCGCDHVRPSGRRSGSARPPSRGDGSAARTRFRA
jgi:signal transduction histidine kinase